MLFMSSKLNVLTVTFGNEKYVVRIVGGEKKQVVLSS